MHPSKPHVSHALALLALAAPALGQSPEGLVQENEPVIGIGLLTSVQNLTVNDAGEWLVLADTDATPLTVDFAVLRLGFPAIREGDPVATPSGASINSFNSLNWRLDDDGNLLWSFRIEGPGITGANDDSLYWNARQLARQLEPVGAPQLPPSFVYRTFLSFDYAGPNRVIAVCELDEDTTPGGVVDGLVAIEFNEFGDPVQTDLLLLAGDEFPTDLFPADGDSTPQVFERLPTATSFRFFRANVHGDFLWSPLLEDGPQVLMIGLDRVIAAEGDVFEDEDDPLLDGRAIANFNNYEADLNDFGEFTYTAALDGDANTNAILVLNGEKFVQEGDALPAWNGATMGNQTQSAFLVANSGDVYWTASLGNALTSENQAYMRNRKVIVRKGQTLVEGVLVADIRTTAEAFDVSRDGRFWIGEVVLQGGSEAAILVDFGLALPIPGCDPNAGSLEVASGTVNLGGSLVVGLDGGQEPGVTSFLFLSRNSLVGPDGCGATTPFGELFLGPPFPFLTSGPPWVGDPAPIPLAVPNRMELVDTTWFAQGMFVDLTGQLPGEDVRLTNGLRLEIGAP